MKSQEYMRFSHYENIADFLSKNKLEACRISDGQIITRKQCAEVLSGYVETVAHNSQTLCNELAKDGKRGSVGVLHAESW